MINENIILRCEDSIEGMFTAVYDAFVYKNKIQKENNILYNDTISIEIGQGENYTLFSTIIDVNTDLVKSKKTVSTIKSRLGENIYGKGTDMESMRDTKRIMEREIKKGSTPLTFEQMEIDTDNYQEITSVEKLTEVLQYLHRVENYKSLTGKTVINNVYTFMRGRTPDFTRARSIFDREKIYHQMLRQEKKIKPAYEGDCYIETAKCYFSLPEEWEKHKMIYLNNDAYGFILSNKYILGLFKYCREARRDIAMEAHEIPENTNTIIQRLINMDDLEVLSHCLLLDDVWVENDLIGAKMYTIFKLGIS